MTCPGCGGPGTTRFGVADRLFRVTARPFDVCLCTRCALEFLWPQPAPEELPAYYPPGYWVGLARADARTELVEAYRRFVLRDHVRFVGAIVAAQRREGSWRRLLDVGCGDGSFLDALGARPALGLDWSAHATGAVLARGYPALRGSLLAAPFAPGSFSLITMLHFLEHVTPAADYLAAARRLLAPGGRLVVQVPNVEAWQCRLLRGRWAGYDAPRHLVNYGTATLRATLERHGFRVRRVTQHSLRDNPTTLANSLAPGLYPPARAARGRRSRTEWPASLGYLGLVLLAIPLVTLEAALGRGAAVMAEAEPG